MTRALNVTVQSHMSSYCQELPRKDLTIANVCLCLNNYETALVFSYQEQVLREKITYVVWQKIERDIYVYLFSSSKLQKFYFISIM